MVKPAEAQGEIVHKILTEDFVARLMLLNRALRELRKMGYLVACSLGTDVVPEIIITRDSEQSITPLLDRASGRFWTTVNGQKYGHAIFEGVDVMWEES
jgi:hypothetical protein